MMQVVKLLLAVLGVPVTAAAVAFLGPSTWFGVSALGIGLALAVLGSWLIAASDERLRSRSAIAGVAGGVVYAAIVVVVFSLALSSSTSFGDN